MAMRTVSLDMRKPREETGGALTHALEPLDLAAKRRDLDTGSSQLDRECQTSGQPWVYCMTSGGWGRLGGVFLLVGHTSMLTMLSPSRGMDKRRD